VRIEICTWQLQILAELGKHAEKSYECPAWLQTFDLTACYWTKVACAAGAAIMHSAQEIHQQASLKAMPTCVYVPGM